MRGRAAPEVSHADVPRGGAHGGRRVDHPDQGAACHGDVHARGIRPPRGHESPASHWPLDRARRAVRVGAAGPH